MKSIVKTLSLTICMILSLHPCVAQERAETKSLVGQYGHNSGWSINLDLLSRDFKVRPRWQIPSVGGRGQIVGDKSTIYVSSGSSKRLSREKTVVTTKLAAVDAATGNLKWEYEFEPATVQKGQETHSGAMASPSSTPLVLEDCVFAVSFTGQLVCVDRASGKKLWSKNLVSNFDAIPVQYGFSASPVVDEKQPDQILVMAAGKKGGLLNLDVKTGDVNWKCETKTFSYSSPVEANFGGVAQWIIVSETQIFGVKKTNGEKLWTYRLAKPGLTNVPCPLVISASELAVSGQGCAGTRMLEILKNGDQWSIKEKWFQPRVQFFYTNWMKLDNRTIIGCSDQFLVTLDITSGKLTGKWRGFTDGNILRSGSRLAILGGRGSLTMLSLLDNGKGLKAEKEFLLAKGRCWTPISLIGDLFYVRCENKLLCFQVSLKPSDKDVENIIDEPKVLELKREVVNAEGPVEKIFEVFQTKGQEAALKLYAEYRANGKLSADQRVSLAEAANEQGLSDLTRMILMHAANDLPNSKTIKNAIKRLGK